MEDLLGVSAIILMACFLAILAWRNIKRRLDAAPYDPDRDTKILVVPLIILVIVIALVCLLGRLRRLVRQGAAVSQSHRNPA